MNINEKQMLSTEHKEQSKSHRKNNLISNGHEDNKGVIEVETK